MILSVKDTYRQAVEAATGGRNTVMYDDKGNPSVMVRIPRFNLADVIDGAPATPHPAFIVDGVVKDAIWISKYQNIMHDGRAYSIPAQDPHTYINYDSAKSACEAKGKGWHLMTNAEWAAIALWSKKNNTMPRGNNDYGKDHAANHERAATATTSDGRTNRILTGTGPATWSHDHTPAGIYDLNGNVWEWVDGLRIEEGQIYLFNDNDFSTPKDALDQWVATGVFFDMDGNTMVLNGSRTTEMDAGKSRGIDTLAGATGFTVPELIKYHALAPTTGDHGGDVIYANNVGSRFVFRGGNWAFGSVAGVFSAIGHNSRAVAASYIGFRAAYVS